jgi:hypothetical protein
METFMAETLETLATRLECIEAMAAAALHEAASGLEFNLTGIEEQVNILCTALPQCPGAATPEMKTRIHHVITRLDELAGMLQQKQFLLRHDLQSASSSHHAARAYLKATKR